MKATNSALVMGGLVFLAGCANGPTARQAMQTPPKEHPTGMPALDDRRPIPVVTQHDSATTFTAAPEIRTESGLPAPRGADALVKAQDPKLNLAPQAAGSAGVSQSETVTLEDSDLTARVKDAISKLNNTDEHLDPALVSRDTNGERKALQNIEVSARKGLVTITGSVPSEAQKSAIEQAATRLHGVVSVSNYLTISQPQKQ